MKKTIILRYVAVLLALTYLFILAVYLLTTGEFFPAWFSLACLGLGVYCLAKSMFFHLDSSFWLGICLVFVAFVGFLNNFFLLSNENLPVFYILAPVYASTFTGIFYRNLLHYKISFAILLEDFLILVYINKIVTLLAFVLSTLALVAVIIGGIYVYKRKTRLRKKRSGWKS